jgi:hypothetical protein
VTLLRLADSADLPGLPRALGLAPRPVVAVVGGAAGLDGDLAGLFSDTIAPVVRARGAIAVDGGTDVGLMRLMGRACAAGPPFPLVGVAAEGTVRFPGHDPASPDAADLDPNHSHFVLVPGVTWGDEAPWLARVATVLAGPHPSVTVLANGGDIAYEDVRQSLAHDRPVLVLAGTGRTADEIAAAASDPAACRDPRAVALAHSRMVRVVHVDNRTRTAALVDEALQA